MKLNDDEVEVLRKLVPHLEFIPGGGDVGDMCDITEEDDLALWRLINRLKGLKPQTGSRPDKQAPDDEIRNWIQANWRPHWWGLMDCDRCLNGRGRKFGNDAPCDPCGRWKHWIEDFRNGRALGK